MVLIKVSLKLQLSERAMFLLQSSKPKVKGFDEKFIMKVVEGQRKISKRVKMVLFAKMIINCTDLIA